MAATNKDKNKALAALTGAALSLPGLNIQAAIPSASIKTNVSYGHYQESGGRMQVDVYHADAVIPLSDRLELAFSLDRDTYSGATPIFSMPAVMANRQKIEQGAITYVDIVSAASGGVTTDILTTFGLNTLQEYKDGELRNKQISDALYTEGYHQAEAEFEAQKAQIEAEYGAKINQLDAQVTTIVDDFDRQKAEIQAGYTEQLNKLNAKYGDDKTALETLNKRLQIQYATLNEQLAQAQTKIDSQKAAIEADYANRLAQLAPLKIAYDTELEQLDAGNITDMALLPPMRSASPSLEAKIVDTAASDIAANRDLTDVAERLEAHLAQLKSQYALNTNRLDERYDAENWNLMAGFEKNTQELQTRYDSNNQQLKTQLENNVQALQSQYDSSGQQLKNQYENNTQALQSQYDSSNQQLKNQYEKNTQALQTQYDSNNRQLKTQYENNDQTLQTQYDSNNQQLKTQYDANHQRLKTQYAGDYQQLVAQYDSDRQLLTDNHENRLLLLEDQLDLALESINGEFVDEKTALSQALKGNQNLVATQRSSLADKFATDQNALVSQLSENKTNLLSQFNDLQNILLDKLQKDEAALLAGFTFATGFTSTNLDLNKASLDANIATLNSDKTQLDANIATLNSDKTELDGRIVNLNSDKTVLDADIAARNSDTAQLDTDIANLNSDKTGLDAKIAARNTDKAQLDADIANLNSDKTGLESRIFTLNSNIANLDTLINTLGGNQTQLASNKTALGTQFVSDDNFLSDTFTSNKSSLSEQFVLATLNLDNRLNSDKTALLLTLNKDIKALDNAQAAVEQNYIAANPRPIPDTIAGAVTIDFPSSSMNQSSYAGFANNPPIAGGSCSGSGSSGCYGEDGFLIGIVEDTSNSTAHLHRANVSLKDKRLEYHADSSGVYIRSQDSKAFSLDSMKFSTAITPDNPDNDPNKDNWEILGFNQAINKNLDKGGTSGKGTCSDYSTCVAYQKIANGFDGTLNLSAINGDFKNINAVWIHYQGYPSTPKDDKTFDLKLDNIQFSPADVSASQAAWDNALNLFKTDYRNNTYTPALNALNSKYSSDLSQLTLDNDTAKASLKSQYDSNLTKLTNDFNKQKSALTDKYNQDLAKLNQDLAAIEQALLKANDDQQKSKQNLTDSQQSLTQLGEDIKKLTQQRTALETTIGKLMQDSARLAENLGKLTQARADLTENTGKLTQARVGLLENIDKLSQERKTLTDNIGKLVQDRAKLTESLTGLERKREVLVAETDKYHNGIEQTKSDYQAAQFDLEARYNNDLAKLIADNETAKTTLKNQYDSDKYKLDEKLTALSEQYNKDIDNLITKYDDDPRIKNLIADFNNQKTSLTDDYDKQLAELHNSNEAAKSVLDSTYQTRIENLKAENQQEIDALAEKYARQKTALLASYQQQDSSLKESYIQQNQALKDDYTQQNQTLKDDYAQQSQAIKDDYILQNQALKDGHVQQSETLEDNYVKQNQAIKDDYIRQNQALKEGYAQQTQSLKDTYIQQTQTLNENYKDALLADKELIDANKEQLENDKITKIDELTDQKKALAALEQQYKAEYLSLNNKNQQELATLTDEYQQKSLALSAEKDEQETALIAEKTQELEKLGASYAQQSQTLLAGNPQAATTALVNTSPLEDTAAVVQDNSQAPLIAEKDKQISEANAVKEAQIAQQKAMAEKLAKEATIALYSDILNTMVPNGNPTVQRFQVQPQETRSMPQFTAKYYFDATTLGISGGLSDEPDFLSNFGSVNLSHEFNDKLTTVSAGYGMTSNHITRSSSHSAGGHSHGEGPNYRALNEESTFHNFNAGLSQILGKNTLYQFSGSYTRQDGYLSNPYKYVYVRGEITPEEYYRMNVDSDFDWHAITGLEIVGTELFREVRPNNRNMWSFSNRLNQHIPALDASIHFDYRFYTDDWGINSHTFELKWYQSLPWGLTFTPSIRYYSQSQADFFAPYFLAPRADSHYSSDFRLSGFGDLSGGVTVGKEFARGIKLEAGFEYVTHSGNLKLGGGGIGDYADFDYYIAHANLNIDLGARPFILGGAGDHHHQHHHHGTPVPAGVMFGHMMNQADEIMVGYRYQYNVQSGAMLHGEDRISDTHLVDNACPSNDAGCLYKPLKMHMQMHMLDLMYAPTDWLNLMVMPQLMSMDMDMSQPLRPFANFDEEEAYGHHAGTQHTSNDIGDTVAMALIKLHDDGTHHVHAGIGISAPTGNIDARLSQGTLKSAASTEITPGSAVLQDYGMQLGSGTWDFKPSLTYTGHADDWSWGAQFNGTKRLHKNKYDYAYGDVFQATGWGSYAIFDWLSASVRGIYTWQGKIQGESNQNHETISPVDFPGNYGGRFVDVGFGLNVSIPDGQFAGHSLSVEWQQPVMTDFNGSQLDRDGALAVSWSYSF